MSKLIKNVIVGCLLLVGVSVSAGETNGVNKNPWVLSLSGGGTTVVQGDGGTVASGGLELGKQGHLLLPSEVGVRQNFGYASEGDTKTFDTALYYTVFPVNFSRFQLGGGVSFGTSWGDVKPTWFGQPEIVTRVSLTKNAGIFGRVGMPLDIAGEKLGDRLVYSVGAFFKW